MAMAMEKAYHSGTAPAQSGRFENTHTHTHTHTHLYASAPCCWCGMLDTSL